ncbi:MAG: hypothetical protein NZ653_07955 [Anaerolineae bacterium]|nr:hypothetical protein [Anaerolineae bacterium]
MASRLSLSIRSKDVGKVKARELLTSPMPQWAFTPDFPAPATDTGLAMEVFRVRGSGLRTVWRVENAHGALA